MEEEAFYGDTGLEKVILPEDAGAFRFFRIPLPESAGRKEGVMTLPAGLLTIEEEAFSNTTAAVIYIPASCTKIETKAFFGNSLLEEIHFAADADEIALNAFDSCPNLTIYAPAGSTAIKVAKYNDIPYVEE